ncbi:unnamed protein product [Prunus armeniaca]|uniref:Methyltransferase type 11 domain-containing protein n=1 Tax=Prunus armeniaca TaxID=36596 RepID=A0A6J5WHW6_PRUAR|nr:unnamed protein product [Prunus armeniaca]
MFRDVSSCNTYNYGDAFYWDARYVEEGGSSALLSETTYQPSLGFSRSAVAMLVLELLSFSALVLFVLELEFPKLRFSLTPGRILSDSSICFVMSEDMVADGYEDVMNVDISSVAIDMMKRKYEHIPQLKCMFPIQLDMQMDVRDMSVFPDESFEGVIDKGTLDSLMCGNDAPISAAQMLGELSRLLLKPGGIYLLVTVHP